LGKTGETSRKQADDRLTIPKAFVERRTNAAGGQQRFGIRYLPTLRARADREIRQSSPVAAMSGSTSYESG